MNSATSWRKQLTFFSLYVAQSVPMSLISTLLPVIMRQEHFSLESIGLLQFIKIPWILKLLWAPLVDRQRSYKQWIISSELAYAFLLIAVAFLDLEIHFPLILILVVLAFIASSTQDIATDALTSLSFRNDVVRANRLQSMGQFAGSILGGGVLVMLYHVLGWTALFLLMSIFVVLLLLPLYFYKTRDPFLMGKSATPEVIGLRDIGSFFKQRGAKGRVLVLMLFNLGVVGTMTMMKPYLVDANYDFQEIGFLYTVYGGGMGFLGSMLLSAYRQRTSKDSLNQGLCYASLLILFSTITIALVATLGDASWGNILLMLACLWGAYGFGNVMVYALAMDYVRPGREGTDFTLQIVILQLSSLLMSGLSGKITALVGYTLFFWIEVGFAILSVGYVLSWRRKG